MTIRGWAPPGPVIDTSLRLFRPGAPRADQHLADEGIDTVRQYKKLIDDPNKVNAIKNKTGLTEVDISDDLKEKLYKQGRAECGECGGEVVPVAGSARALGAC